MPTILLAARSASASDYKDQAFWRSSSLQVQRLLGVSSFADVAEFVEASASCSYRDDELMYALGDAVLQRLAELDTDALAAILRVHATWRFRNGQLLVRLQELLYEHMQHSRATAAGLSSSLLSLAQLLDHGLLADPHRELLGAAMRMVAEHLSFFSASQLSEVVEALAAYGMRGDRQVSTLLHGLGAVLAREVPRFTGARCAATVRSFAKLRAHDERLLGAIAGHLRDKDVRDGLTAHQLSDTLYGFAKFTCQDTALLDLLSIEARRRLHAMDVPLMSSVLASVAKAGVSSSVLTNRAVAQLRRLPPEEVDVATQEELAKLAMAFAKLQARDGKLFDVIAESFLRRTSPPFSHAPLPEIVNVSHAFTKAHVLHPQLFTAIASTILDRFGELSLVNAVKYLHGIAKVDYLPPSMLQEQLLRLLQSDQVSELGVFDLLKLATSAKRLGIRVPSLEAHISTVLPNEARDEATAPLGPGRRPVRPGPTKRRKSARKRKWTW